MVLAPQFLRQARDAANDAGAGRLANRPYLDGVRITGSGGNPLISEDFAAAQAPIMIERIAALVSVFAFVASPIFFIRGCYAMCMAARNRKPEVDYADAINSVSLLSSERYTDVGNKYRLTYFRCMGCFILTFISIFLFGAIMGTGKHHERPKIATCRGGVPAVQQNQPANSATH
jgi:hypothetical protein